MLDKWTTGGMHKYWTRDHGWGRENGEDHKWDGRMTSRDMPAWPGSDGLKIETLGKKLERPTPTNGSKAFEKIYIHTYIHTHIIRLLPGHLGPLPGILWFCFFLPSLFILGLFLTISYISSSYVPPIPSLSILFVVFLVFSSLQFLFPLSLSPFLSHPFLPYVPATATSLISPLHLLWVHWIVHISRCLIFSSTLLRSSSFQKCFLQFFFSILVFSCLLFL